MCWSSWRLPSPAPDAGNRLHLRTEWRYFLLAWLGPLALTAVSVGLAAALGLWQLDLSPLSTGGLPGWATVGLLMLAMPVLAPVYWGEESGWTNYLRPRINDGHPVRAVLVTGFIWAVWHYPLAFLGYTAFDRPWLAFPVWTVLFMCHQVMLSWLWARSGSIWPTSLAHAGNNVVNGLLLELLLGGAAGPGQVTVMLLTIAPLAVCAIAIIRSDGLRPSRRHGVPEVVA